MAPPQVIYLKPDESIPPKGPFVLIERDPEGPLFYGLGRDENGEEYHSYPEDEVDLDHALAAAYKWASERGITTVYVQMVVEGWD